MESDTPKADDRWTVRGIPETVRDDARKAAKRADLTVAEWLIRAIRGHIAAEYAEQQAVAAEIVGPDRKPMTLYGEMSDTVSANGRLDDIARALQIGQMIARLRNRRGFSRELLREAQAALVRHLSADPASASDAAADRTPSPQRAPLRIAANGPDTPTSSPSHDPAP